MDWSELFTPEKVVTRGPLEATIRKWTVASSRAISLLWSNVRKIDEGDLQDDPNAAPGERWIRFEVDEAGLEKQMLLKLQYGIKSWKINGTNASVDRASVEAFYRDVDPEIVGWLVAEIEEFNYLPAEKKSE